MNTIIASIGTYVVTLFKKIMDGNVIHIRSIVRQGDKVYFFAKRVNY